MIGLWISVALLAGSWLFGLGYYVPASPLAWTVVVVAGVLSLWWGLSRGKGDRHLLCAAPEGPLRQKVPVPFSRTSCGRRCRRAPAAGRGPGALAVPCGALAVAAGLLLGLRRFRRPWLGELAAAGVTAGLVLAAQSVFISLYATLTAGSRLALAAARRRGQPGRPAGHRRRRRRPVAGLPHPAAVASPGPHLGHPARSRHRLLSGGQSGDAGRAGLLRGEAGATIARLGGGRLATGNYPAGLAPGPHHVAAGLVRGPGGPGRREFPALRYEPVLLAMARPRAADPRGPGGLALGATAAGATRGD